MNLCPKISRSILYFILILALASQACTVFDEDDVQIPLTEKDEEIIANKNVKIFNTNV